jgi:phosphotransferase family enzyme
VAAARLNGVVHAAGNLPLGDDLLPVGDGLLPLRDGLLSLGDDLRNPLGVPTVIREIASSERSRVWLVEFGDEPAVVKQVAGGADASARFRREIAALTVAASVRPVIVPELLGMDADARVMVLEYVAHTGPTAAGWHADYATALARLHAATAIPPHDAGSRPRAGTPSGHTAGSACSDSAGGSGVVSGAGGGSGVGWGAGGGSGVGWGAGGGSAVGSGVAGGSVAPLGPGAGAVALPDSATDAASCPGRDSADLPDHVGRALSDVQAFVGFAAQLGVAVPSGAEDQLAALVDRLAGAGRRALLHGDPCPDNAVPTAAGMRFIDLEQAAWGPGAVELAYLTMAFPTCLCATGTSDAVLAEAIAAYRGTWRAITGTDPDGDLTDAALGWLITGDALVWRARRGAGDHLARAARRDWRWGTGTARERVLHRLGVVAHAARNRDDLAHVARLCSDLSAAMLRRWTGLAPLPVANGDPLSTRGAVP